MPLPPSRASGPYRPTRLGQWEVVAKIAGGGMSAVYLGRHIDSTAEQPNVVALKIARHDASMDDRLVKMFLEEGKLIQRLVHPNIVRTLEVGADEQQDYIAMELMLGKTFAVVHDTIAARGVRLSPEIAAWSVARVADALQYAHELTDAAGRPQNLVHRDVNPANIFATFRGEVKLFDFGLAKVTTGDTSSSTQMVAGKLSYLSPEQVMQIPVDRRSDIFSLGTTLWELLTGKRLFRRDTDIETVRAVQLGPIPDIRSIAPELPEELARITKTALERNREHRYAHASALSRDLDAWLYQRTSPQDVSTRLAQLIDTLFPGEQKRQGGWLKPAITSAAMSMARAPTMAAPLSRPPGPEVRRDSRETTAVMHNAPIPTPRDGVPAAVPPADNTMATRLDATMISRSGSGPSASSASSLASTMVSASGKLPPGPLTPRDGIPAVTSSAASVSPPTPRFGSMSPPPPSVAPPPPSRRNPPVSTPSVLPPPSLRSARGPAPIESDPPPPSRTEVGRPAVARSSEPPTDVTSAPVDASALDLERTMMTPSPSFPPAPRTPSFAAPAKPAARTSVPPPAATKSASIVPTPQPFAAKSPSIIPTPPPSPSMMPSPAPTPRAAPVSTNATGIRPKRAPIPLPSRIPLPSKATSAAARPATPSVVPHPPAKRPDTVPPDSGHTQVDVPAPERKS